MTTNDVATREGLRQQLRQVQKAAVAVAGYAWEVIGTTIACPCCGVGWWKTTGDTMDDWHEDGCDFYAQLVVIGLGTGKRVPKGLKAFDKYGYMTKEWKAAEEELCRNAVSGNAVKP